MRQTTTFGEYEIDVELVDRQPALGLPHAVDPIFHFLGNPTEDGGGSGGGGGGDDGVESFAGGDTRLPSASSEEIGEAEEEGAEILLRTNRRRFADLNSRRTAGLRRAWRGRLGARG